MKSKETGYPSIDKTHEKGEKYFDIHPLIPNLSIYNAINLIGNLYKNESAIDCLNLKVSYKEMIEQAATLSKAFKELGIKSGDIITVSMPNFSQAVIVYLAANRIGAITTFLNSFAEIEEVCRYLNLFESPIFINYDKDKEYNDKIKLNTKVRQVITLLQKDLNNKKFANNSSSIIGNSDYISFNDLGLVAKHYKKPFNTLYSGNQDSLILFTSGTTGNPKAVVLTNKNILASGIYMKNSTNLSNVSGEKSLVCVPFTYPYGFATSTLMSLLCGREAILAPNLTDTNISYFLSKNPNIVFGSPALLELIKRNTPDNLDLSSIHTFISGGDFLTLPQEQDGLEFFKRHNANVNICNGSGNAETVGANTNAVGIKNKQNTVGKILLGSSAIIVNSDTLEELKYGEEGLLCISGKHVFKEYFKEPKLTEEAKFYYKGKEYFKTGTRGILDKEGYFTLTGRASRFYIISTLNKIYCDYVQNIISLIDVVETCAVVKKPNDEMLYTGKAFIVLKPGIEPTEETRNYILNKCSSQLISTMGEKFQLKPYEIPTSIDFVNKLPRTKADKIDYSSLEMLANYEYNKEKKLAKKLTLEQREILE